MSKQLTHQQRYLIKEMVEQGKTKTQISEALGLALSTTRKWIRRAKKDKLVSQMGRPKQGNLSSFSKIIIEEVKKLSDQKPGYGGKSIRVDLLKEESLGSKIPSSASIDRYLKEKHLVKRYDKHSDHPATAVIKSKRPHHVWQMDAQGNKTIKDLATVAPIHIKDTFTTLYIHSYPCPLTSKSGHAKTEDYQRVLRMAWSEWGMNRILQTDHESIFYDNNKKSPFPTRFHLWLIGMGIQLVFTPKGKPQKQGAVERSHRTIFNRVFYGQLYKTWRELNEAMQNNRYDLNHLFPSSSLADEAPLKKFPHAQHSGKIYSVDDEENIFNIKRVYSYLARKEQKWFRDVGSAKTISLGNLSYYLKNGKDKQEVRIIFNNRKKKLIIYDGQNNLIAEEPLKMVDFKSLAGNISLEGISAIQLKFPF